MMHALVVSPIPSNPVNQGNSARISRICELLQYHGYYVHFVYYGMEGIHPDQRKAMEDRWDSFHFVSPNISKAQTRFDGYGIDDYCGDELPEYIKQLQSIWQFDIAIINYVWMSRVADGILPETYSVIDTHDLFGGRHEVLQEQGVAPAWFFCSPEEEARGLSRADSVIAIQDVEAAVLSERFSGRIFTVGHILPQNFLPVRKISRKIRVGYIASDNPSNRISLEVFLKCLADRPSIANNFEFHIAGNISNRIRPDLPGFHLRGFIKEASDFYRDVDIIMNINISGTGLKIKTVEALSFGLPLITTRDGMCGIPSRYHFHLCADMTALLDCLAEVSTERSLANLRDASREVFNNYIRKQLSGFRGLLDAASSRNLETC
ncbi:glycosyltransferase [Gluconacetobacter tumulicola]|uniref:Glycosyltransferase n=1 Tax=Gluconacetobacter tumulicola TaxID=1017177 RepID=A0A7W4JH87_9PROT|nr:glycosyltransferase [Gluconacetobacter tumulicola]MBB2181208.1 glycosyltransferase [Gluconacetobacter tumulicola]